MRASSPPSRSRSAPHVDVGAAARSPVAGRPGRLAASSSSLGSWTTVAQPRRVRRSGAVGGEVAGSAGIELTGTAGTVLGGGAIGGVVGGVVDTNTADTTAHHAIAAAYAPASPIAAHVDVRFPLGSARPEAATLGGCSTPTAATRLLQTRDRRFDGWFVTRRAHDRASTAGRAVRPCTPQAPQRRVLPDRRGRPAARLPGVQALPSRRLARLAGVERARRRRRPGDAPHRRRRRRPRGRPWARRAGSATASATSHRLVTDELGAGPLAIARAQRAQTARTLIETTRSAPRRRRPRRRVRQRPPVQRHRARRCSPPTPSELRARRRSGPTDDRAVPSSSSSPCVNRSPPTSCSAFLAARAVPGVEHWDGTTYHRALDLPGGHGTVDASPSVAPDGAAVRAVLRLADWRDLAAAVRRVRRLLDLDADPVAVDDALGADPALAPLVAATPGLRVARQRRPVRDGRAGRRSASRSPSPALAPSPAASCAAHRRAGWRVDRGGPLTHVWPTRRRWRRSTRRCCRCRAAGGAR